MDVHGPAKRCVSFLLFAVTSACAAAGGWDLDEKRSSHHALEDSSCAAAAELLVMAHTEIPEIAPKAVIEYPNETPQSCSIARLATVILPVVNTVVRGGDETYRALEKLGKVLVPTTIEAYPTSLPQTDASYLLLIGRDYSPSVCRANGLVPKGVDCDGVWRDHAMLVSTRNCEHGNQVMLLGWNKGTGRSTSVKVVSINGKTSILDIVDGGNTATLRAPSADSPLRLTRSCEYRKTDTSSE